MSLIVSELSKRPDIKLPGQTSTIALLHLPQSLCDAGHFSQPAFTPLQRPLDARQVTEPCTIRQTSPASENNTRGHIAKPTKLEIYILPDPSTISRSSASSELLPPVRTLALATTGHLFLHHDHQTAGQAQDCGTLHSAWA